MSISARSTFTKYNPNYIIRSTVFEYANSFEVGMNRLLSVGNLPK